MLSKTEQMNNHGYTIEELGSLDDPSHPQNQPLAVIMGLTTTTKQVAEKEEKNEENEDGLGLLTGYNSD